MVLVLQRLFKVETTSFDTLKSTTVGSSDMSDERPSHVCRACGHVGEPKWRDWVMSERKEDGSISEYAGSTPYCTECSSIVYTQREWWAKDYDDETGWYPLLGLLGVPAFLFLIGIGVSELAPAATDALYNGACLLSIVSFIGTLIALEVGKQRYIKQREEE
jgi:hypothetical protein